MPGGLGIVGVGAIAEAIVTGLCEGEDTEVTIHLSPRSAGRASRLAARYPSVHVAESSQAAVERPSSCSCACDRRKRTPHSRI